MSLLHAFRLLEEGAHPYEGYSAWAHAPDALHIHDDVLRYLDDTLQWIPAFNPAKGERVQGLCSWGVTVIDKSGASVAARVFDRWAELLALGPPRLVLTGGWSVEPDGTGHDEKLQVDREPLVGALRTLAAWARRAETGSHVIAHSGI